MRARGKKKTQNRRHERQRDVRVFTILQNMVFKISFNRGGESVTSHTFDRVVVNPLSRSEQVFVVFSITAQNALQRKVPTYYSNREAINTVDT